MEKREILLNLLSFLNDNPRTQIAELPRHIEGILTQRNVIGIRNEHRGGGIYTTNVRTPDSIALLINDVIYDLLYKERIITPGYNKDNLDLPFLHVSDNEKLKGLLREVSN